MPYDPADIVALRQALDRLRAINPRGARIFELRGMDGLTVPEIAAELNISERTVLSAFARARWWLREQLDR